MHDDELRALVREAVARQMGMTAADDGRAAFGERALPLEAHREVPRDARAGSFDGRAGSPSPAPSWKTHVSHGRYVFLAPTDPDAPCVVQPEVRCHHCGFCQSYGH
jgi:hypothetical protein